MKALFYCKAISPYRNEFFNHLATLCDLTVCYEVENSEHKHRDAKWFEGQEVKYNKVKLNRKRALIRFSKGDIESVLKEGSFDIVILGHYLSFTAYDAIKFCKKNKVKIGVSADGAKVKKEKKLITFVKRHLLKGCNFVLSPSQQTDEYFLRYCVKKENIFRYNFTSLAQRDIMPFTARENRPVTILSVGQFIHRKGFDILIRLAKDINAQIVICGAEPTEEYLRLSEQCNASITFLGFKRKEELKQVYLDADIFVLPTREDVWGLVINEAMNYSLPIVTTNACVAGVELLDGEWVVNVDEKDILNAICKLVNDYELRQTVGKINNEKIQGFTIENMAERVYEILNKV